MKVILYAAFVYAIFLWTLAYAVGFVEGIVVPRAIDVGPTAPLPQALAIDAGWFVLFAAQHSGMARPSFKRWWTQVVPVSAERSTYVLASSLMFALLFAMWRPIPIDVWRVEQPAARWMLTALSYGGWMLALLATFAIDHLELFGLRQAAASPVLRTPVLYKLVRHPLYLGFLVAFWATPTMTVGHLLFASGSTVYVMVGMHFEERDLVRTFGQEYTRYRARVPALLPWPRPGRAARPETLSATR
jgi:protein-S-isoprenylcysteine O-methyltransferase Ste14